MAQTDPAILLDSRNAGWKLGPGWVEYSEGQFMGGSTAWARYNDSTSVSLEFTGTSISYIGNAVEYVPWNFTSSIDGSAPEYHAIAQESGLEQITYAWYVSPTLSEGEHTLVLSNITKEVALDYAVIKPSRSQNVRDQTLVVDDRDPLMKFSGSWKDVNTRYKRYETRLAVPYGGGTHTSNRVGDVLQFPFTGSSVRVYGFYDWTISGKLSLSFSIDDWAPEEITYPRNDSSQGSLMVDMNFLYYEISLPAGNHVLTINVTNVVGQQMAIIDAIHYKAAFDTLETMPQITIPALASESSGLSSPTPSGSAIPTRRSSRAGAIAGGVVGGVVSLAIIMGLIWFLLSRRRTRKTQNHPTVTQPFPYSEPPSTPRPTLQAAWSDGGSIITKKTGPRSRSTLDSMDAAPIADIRDARVEELERQVRQLARQTEELHNTHISPPPYNPV